MGLEQNKVLCVRISGALLQVDEATSRFFNNLLLKREVSPLKSVWRALKDVFSMCAFKSKDLKAADMHQDNRPL